MPVIEKIIASLITSQDLQIIGGISAYRITYIDDDQHDIRHF